MDFVGLELGQNKFRAVELKGVKGKKRELVRYASEDSPPYALSSDAQIDWAEISSALDKFYSSAGFSTRNVVSALPESQVFTRVIAMPRMSQKELASAMKWEAEQYVPIPLEEVSFDYHIIDKGGGDKMDVLLVAAPLTLTKKYLKMINDAHLRVVGLETESIATARSLVGLDSVSPPTMVVSIGATTTDISIISRGNIRFTRSISGGGEALVRAVAQHLNFETDRAEEYLRSYGLEESALEGKVVQAIKPIFDVLVSEVKRSIAYYISHRKEDSIERLILSGEFAVVPGVLVSMASAVDLEVQLADPWETISIPSKFKREELEDIGPEFAVVVGLALKEI